MALDFTIAGDATMVAGLEYDVHEQMMAAAKRLRLGTLIRLDDYYVIRSYAPSEVPALRRDLQQVATSLGKSASAVFARLDAVLSRAEELRAGIEVVAD